MTLTITKNDVAIFLVLQEFQCLPVHFIAALLGKTPKVYQLTDGKTETRYEYLRHRLAELRVGGYIKIRKNLRPRKGQKSRYDVYALSTKGRDEIPRSLAIRHTMRLTPNAHHDLGSCLIAASFKIGTMADERLRFFDPNEVLSDDRCPKETRASDSPYAIPVKYWYRDSLIQTTREGSPSTKKHDFRPIGVASRLTEDRERKVRFNIEYDRDTEGNMSEDPERSSVERHLRMTLALLDEGFYKQHFGTAKFYVPIISTTARRNEVWKATLREITDGRGHDRILFDVLPDWDVTEEYPTATGWALERSYERVGYPPFSILEALGATTNLPPISSKTSSKEKTAP